MASSSRNGCRSLGLLLLLLLLSLAQAARGARSVPAGRESEDRMEKTEDIFWDHEGTVLIPGAGRVEIGGPVKEVPKFSDFDHSVPAATSAQFLPGADDTFVPNPGFEMPNPFHP